MTAIAKLGFPAATGEVDVANPDIRELNQRAAQLRSLADHIETLVNQPKNHSTTAMKTWAGPNADAVRGKLKSWHTTCGTVAKALRDEAQQCSQGARDLQDNKK
ncbi:WXG100 family type VII secretion target [Streptomyces ureilyticus]|uniref:WXG100 family type VII secretion target n=1 Tax=Streptomyces ureilyticus TaxID=1775131 RepID=UPI002E2AAB95|nr:WXG100 family type VII secretion target [Streptomyces ureilyticus]